MHHSLAIVQLGTKEVLTHPYTEDHLRHENAGTIYTGAPDLLSIYSSTEKAIKSGTIIVKVYDCDPPQFDPTESRLEEVAPILVNGKWHRHWKKIDYTDQEKADNLNVHRVAKRAEIEARACSEIDVVRSGYPDQISDLWLIMLAEALVIKKREGNIKTALLGDSLIEGETNLELADKIIVNHIAYRKAISPILGKMRQLLYKIETTHDVPGLLSIVW